MPEVPLDAGEVLVGGDHGGGVELIGGDGGAQDVEPVQGGFLIDPGLVAGDGQAGVGDGAGEVLGGLGLADPLAGLASGRPGAAEPAGGYPGAEWGAPLRGGGPQALAFAGAVRGQDRVAA